MFALRVAVPGCYGNTEPKLGENAILECNMTFSGGQPDLEWSHNNRRIDSEDHYDVGVAKKRIALVASHTHDKAKYTCNVSFGNMQESCNLTLNISCKYMQVSFLIDRYVFTRFFLLSRI